MSKICLNCQNFCCDFLTGQIASRVTSIDEYCNDLDLPTIDRRLFRHIKKELAKHGQHLVQTAPHDHHYNFSIKRESGLIPEIGLELALAYLKHIREES